MNPGHRPDLRSSSWRAAAISVFEVIEQAPSAYERCRGSARCGASGSASLGGDQKVVREIMVFLAQPWFAPPGPCASSSTVMGTTARAGDAENPYPPWRRGHPRHRLSAPLMRSPARLLGLSPRHDSACGPASIRPAGGGGDGHCGRPALVAAQAGCGTAQRRAAQWAG